MKIYIYTHIHFTFFSPPLCALWRTSRERRLQGITATVHSSTMSHRRRYTRIHTYTHTQHLHTRVCMHHKQPDKVYSFFSSPKWNSFIGKFAAADPLNQLEDATFALITIEQKFIASRQEAFRIIIVKIWTLHNYYRHYSTILTSTIATRSEQRNKQTIEIAVKRPWRWFSIRI